MSAGVRLTGLVALQHFFATAGENIRSEAMQVVRETTEQAAEDIRRRYPEQSRTARGTGTLRARVRTNYPSSTVLVGVVSSSAPHAHLYEFGTKVRATKKSGANRGRMPAARVTPRIAQVRRAEMEQKLLGVVRGAGFEID